MSKIAYGKILIQPEKSKSTCQIFVLDFPLTTDEPADVAQDKIFGLIEVELPPDRKVTSFINSLMEEIKPERLLRQSKDPDAIFENLVQKVNYRYMEIAGNKFFHDQESALPKINALLALKAGQNIYLAQKGKIFPFLIYEIRPQNYKIINITEVASGREARQSNVNLFTNIVSGKINANDYLLFTNGSLLDYFSLEKLCKIVSTSNPDESAGQLKELLEGSANPGTAFAALILRLQPKIRTEAARAAVRVPEQISMPQHSMAGLLQTAAETEKLLTPSLRLNLGKNIFSFFGKIKNSFRGPRKEKPARLEYYASQFTPQSGIKKIFKLISWLLLSLGRAIYLLIKKIILLFVNLFKIIFYLVTNKSGRRRETFQAAVNNLRQTIGALKIKFNRLPRLSQILLIFAIIFGVLFLQSTVLLYRKYKKEVAAENLNQKIEAIQNKKSAAEASIIYNDEEGARKLLAEAETLLNQFPQKSKNEQTTYENLKKEIKLLREKLRHLANIENPILIANFTNQNPNAEVDEFLISKNNLFAFDHQAAVVYKLNLETKEIINKSTSGLNLKHGFLKNATSALFYQPEKKFFEFDFENDILRQIETVLNENETKIDDLAIYNQRLYVLDAASGQIFRHAPTLVGFSRGAPWLKEDLDIGNAKSLAIDGSIYLAKADGEIIKLSNGQKTNFTLSVDPPLASPTKIWTSTDSDYLYILEPAGKRLIVLDKNGKLKVQYFSEQFNDLADFDILEKEKKIYLLGGTQVYGIIATHLQ